MTIYRSGRKTSPATTSGSKISPAFSRELSQILTAAALGTTPTATAAPAASFPHATLAADMEIPGLEFIAGGNCNSQLHPASSSSCCSSTLSVSTQQLTRSNTNVSDLKNVSRNCSGGITTAAAVRAPVWQEASTPHGNYYYHPELDVWIPKQGHSFRSREECYQVIYTLTQFVKCAQTNLSGTAAATSEQQPTHESTSLCLTVSSYLREWYGWKLHLGLLANCRVATVLPPNWSDTIVVIGSGPAANCVIDFEFKAKFVVARATETYQQYLNSVPDIFLGTVQELMVLLHEITTAMQNCFQHVEITTAPWRKGEFLRSLYEACIAVDFRASRALLYGLCNTTDLDPTPNPRHLATHLTGFEVKAITTHWNTLRAARLLREALRVELPEWVVASGSTLTSLLPSNHRSSSSLSEISSPTSPIPAATEFTRVLSIEGLLPWAEDPEENNEMFEKIQVPSANTNAPAQVSALSQQLRRSSSSSVCDLLLSRLTSLPRHRHQSNSGSPLRESTTSEIQQPPATTTTSTLTHRRSSKLGLCNLLPF